MSAATGIPRENVEGALGYKRQDSNSSVTKRKAHNGKVKGLWEHANDEPPPPLSNSGLSSIFVNLFKKTKVESTEAMANGVCESNSHRGFSGKRRKNRRKV